MFDISEVPTCARNDALSLFILLVLVAFSDFRLRFSGTVIVIGNRKIFGKISEKSVKPVNSVISRVRVFEQTSFSHPNNF